MNMEKSRTENVSDINSPESLNLYDESNQYSSKEINDECVVHQPTVAYQAGEKGIPNEEEIDTQRASDQVVFDQPRKADNKERKRGRNHDKGDYFAVGHSDTGTTAYYSTSDEICCYACLIGCQDALSDVVQCMCCHFCCRKLRCCQCETENDSCECCGDSCPDCSCCECCGDSCPDCSCCECCTCDCDCSGLGDCCTGLGACCGDVLGGVGECLGGCVAGLLTGCFS